MFGSMDLSDDGQWPILYLHEHLRKINSDDAEGKNQQAANEPDGDERARPALNDFLINEPLDEKIFMMRPSKKKNTKGLLLKEVIELTIMFSFLLNVYVVEPLLPFEIASGL